MYNSNNIKGCLLRYFRFKRGFCVGTEVNTFGLADIAGYDYSISFEVEVKTSKSDLKRDRFKEKHSNPDKMLNKFYFCVPRELLEETEKLVLTLNKDYGIIVYDVTEHDLNKTKHYYVEEVTIYRRAKKLNDRDHTRFKRDLHMRISSELANMHKDMYNINK